MRCWLVFMVLFFILVLTNNIFAQEDNNTCYPCLTGDFWTREKRSVVRIITFRESETILCTGTLINNGRRNGKPYILTAHHCLADQRDVDQAVFTFNYEDTNCDGIPRVHGAAMIGGTLRASSYEHDFALIELNSPVPREFQPYFAGWDVTDKEKDQVSCIHHPQAGIKRISIENDFVTRSNYEVTGLMPRATDAFWKVRQWDIGITENGSSGAPLFDKHHRVIGTLSGGMSACGFPYNDYFQRLGSSWRAAESPGEQLQCWLDPESSGVTTLEGFDPLSGGDAPCDTISTIDLAKTSVTVYPNPVVTELIGSIQVCWKYAYQVTVYDSQGQEGNVAIDFYGNNFVVDASQLKRGIYFLRIVSRDKVYYRRFVKN